MCQNKVCRQIKLKDRVHITGGAVNPAIMRAKKQWMRSGEYSHQEESSLKGAALLGLNYLTDNP